MRQSSDAIAMKSPLFSTSETKRCHVLLGPEPRGHVERQHQSRARAAELDFLRADLHFHRRPVLAPVPEAAVDGNAGPPASQRLIEHRQLRGRTEVAQGESPGTLPRPAIVLHRGLVHVEDREAVVVVDPHRRGVAVEQHPVVLLRLLRGSLGAPALDELLARRCDQRVHVIREPPHLDRSGNRHVAARAAVRRLGGHAALSRLFGATTRRRAGCRTGRGEAARDSERARFAKASQELVERRAPAGATAQQSEENYRLLFDRNPNWIVFNIETLRFLVNNAAVKGSGYTRSEFLSMTIEDIREPADIPRLRAIVANAAGRSARPHLAAPPRGRIVLRRGGHRPRP